MFNRNFLAPKTLAPKTKAYCLPACTLLATVLWTTSVHANIDRANAIINPTHHCSDTTQLQTLHPKNQSTQQRTINCMLTQLHYYQQADRTARQQYFAYKAQAWLNYAYHENSIKSKTAASNQAVQAGTAILQLLQQGTEEDTSLTSAIPSTSALMRPDLWAILSALKDSGGIENAPRELAFSEVALVWAAADQCERGWRQSGAHFRMADRWLEQAREAYVNAHDSPTNVALDTLSNHYFKQFAPLDSGDDRCQGQILPMNKQILSAAVREQQSSIVAITNLSSLGQLVPSVQPKISYRIAY